MLAFAANPVWYVGMTVGGDVLLKTTWTLDATSPCTTTLTGKPGDADNQ